MQPNDTAPLGGAPREAEPLWSECGACHRRQSRHEKFPRCAYCNGRIWPVDDAPFTAYRGIMPELVTCPACEDDGKPCAVCKPEAYREAKEAEIAALQSQLAAATARVREVEAERDALQADAERLDWLDANYAMIEWLVPNSGIAVCWVASTNDGVKVDNPIVGEGYSLREAVDNARQEKIDG